MDKTEVVKCLEDFCEARDSCKGCPLFKLIRDDCDFETMSPEILATAVRCAGLEVEIDKETPVRSDYWANVCEIQKKQTKKGLEKYGQRLEDNVSLSPIERLEYLEEELIDGLMYIEHIKACLRDLGAFAPVKDLKQARANLDRLIAVAEGKYKEVSA